MADDDPPSEMAPPNPPPQLQPSADDRPALPSRKALWVAYALLVMGGGGFLGLHRFYLGYRRSGLVQLALGATCLTAPFVIQGNDLQIFLIPPVLLWFLVDVFLMPGMVRKANLAAAGQP